MYTRRKRCLPIFHSTSTTSKPSVRATRSAARGPFPNSRRDSPAYAGLKLSTAGGNKKVGLRPPHGATRFRAKTEYIPPTR